MIPLPNPRGFTSDKALLNWVRNFCDSQEADRQVEDDKLNKPQDKDAPLPSEPKKPEQR
jgi:hypothetical protein